MKLFTPGPVAMDPETINAAGRQAQYFRTREFSHILNDCAEMLGEVIDAPENSKTIFLTASGTGAMEAAVINLFTRQDKILIVCGGSFGKRFKTICEIHDIPAVSIDLAWDEAFSHDMLTRYANMGFTGMLINMCETSTGQLYPMKVISEFCAENNMCLVVDAISSFLCDFVKMRDLKADAVILSSQKGFALHPGMSFIVITDKAYKERCQKNSVRSLYFRLSDYAEDMRRGQTPYTPAVSVVNQLHSKLEKILREGIWAQIYHIESLASYFRGQLIEKTRFSIPQYPLSNCLTPVFCEKNNAMEIFEILKNRHDIYVTPCAGTTAPFLFRAAHMSRQLNEHDIDDLISALRNF